ncbi:FAD/NAD(P)-binding domain-containing protein [Penicillium verhagenii]|uniref:FAD/NAD(P)-binding domain-containing protein n=1 Tax=Penicillium verhagenii TaxID=1562060 RepID=UPI002545788C|nr:FAD/NAD(P)-binding domain-containing protein [Penicillium verhagenii]KAJ5947516.1 FAD/NAD(P)-binding domain-containing protein [Penicillium verhagenii]
MVRQAWWSLVWGLALASFCQCEDNTIFRDVAIIGGGAAGTFAAVKLHDAGKSTILIEKEAILGGQTNTYQDPLTNQTVDYGVQVFHNQQFVKDYFDRLDVPWKITDNAFVAPSHAYYLDSQTAKPFNYTRPNPKSGLEAYVEQLAKYPDIEQGFFLPDPVPEDLLLPFGNFIKKYPEIANATLAITNFGQGLGDNLEQTTLYVFKNFGTDVVRDISIGFLISANMDNHEIYDHATQLLQPDVLLSSVVVSTTQRNHEGVELIVKTPTGYQKVKAKKLLIAIPQKLDNMYPFDLDRRESNIFGKFMNTGYYTSLVNNTGLPANFYSYSISADTPYNVPKLPGVYGVTPTAIDGVFDIKYGSPSAIPDEDVQYEILSYVRALQANGLAEKVPGSPGFVAYNSHAPFELTVSPDEIRDGFYNDLYALQGYRNTWYTGAAFHTQDSSWLWNFTSNYVLPGLLE